MIALWMRPLRQSAASLFLGWMAMSSWALCAMGQSAATRTRVSPPRHLFLVKAEGGRPRQLTHATDRMCGSPDWSPDGKWIAFDTWRTNEDLQAAQVAVIRADGTDARDLGPGAMPSWSPDGTQLVCHTYNSPQTIVVMNAGGTGRETILNHWGSPRWSPRGDRIASVSPEGTIALFDLSTGLERAIFHGPYSLWQGFSISPDGLRFCFGDSQGGIGLATLDERTMQAGVRWLVKGGLCYHSSWAPDGKRVVFAWQRSEQHKYQLYVMDVDADKTPTLLSGPDPARNHGDPDWSPDGRTIVYATDPPP
jgi:TolB protein